MVAGGKAGRVAVEEGRRVQSERNRERGAAASAGSEPREWDPKAKSTNAQTVAFCRREWKLPTLVSCSPLGHFPPRSQQSYRQ